MANKIIQMYKNDWMALINGVKICFDHKILDHSC